MLKRILAISFCLFSSTLAAAEFAGVFIEDEIKTANDQTLVLNGAGLREKLWVDVYVGSLYLGSKSNDVAEILSQTGPWRVHLDFIYKEVDSKKLLDGWREGFEKNQDEASLRGLQSRIEQFYGYFGDSALAKDRYVFEYIPDTGTRISKNDNLLGTIPGEDFENALLEIWLGNYPANKALKKGMLGL